MLSYTNFKNLVLGKAYDYDAAYGYQCWDGYAKYADYLGAKIVHCTSTGYVKDIANNRKTNGILNDFTDVGLKATLVPGDLCVWGNCAACPDSHIAIYDHDASGKVYFLGQNQGGKSAFSVAEIDVSGIIGVFRPKKLTASTSTTTTSSATNLDVAVLNKKPSQWVSETGTFTVTVSAIKIRKAPSLKGTDTGVVYEKGQSVNYDGYVINDGYVWISWISSSSKERRWMAAGVAKNGVNVTPYGTFK
jgi:hypothetical protein